MTEATQAHQLANEAWHQYGLGHMDTARVLAEELLLKCPGSIDGALLLASLAVDTNQPIEALSLCLESTLSFLPDDDNLFRLGSILSQAGRHASALRFLQRALAARADNKMKEIVIIAMSDCLMLLGRRTEALRLLGHWNQVDPSLGLVRSDLQRLREELKGLPEEEQGDAYPI